MNDKKNDVVLEGEAEAHDYGVIVGVVAGDCGLKGYAAYEAHAAFGRLGSYGKLAHDDSRCEEGLGLAISGASEVAGRVQFEFGCEVLAELVLGYGV